MLCRSTRRVIAFMQTRTCHFERISVCGNQIPGKPIAQKSCQNSLWLFFLEPRGVSADAPNAQRAGQRGVVPRAH